MPKINAILVSVDYTDILSITLPYNRHHFDKFYVVTSHKDSPNLQRLCQEQHAHLVSTDLFYAGGAIFNKWLALEHGLDEMGREGWISILDADILWPKVIPEIDFRVGCLYTPYRHMMEDLNSLKDKGIPPENEWESYPIHRNFREFPGYTQIFHALDKCLGLPPWHETNWKHAGGADSFFQFKWAEERKIRPPFKVLHLGPAGINWCGRSSNYVDGSTPEHGSERKQKLRELVNKRRTVTQGDKYKHEKISYPCPRLREQ